MLSHLDDKGFMKRSKIQGGVPWDEYFDDTLFEIGNEPLHECSFETELMLRAGGKDKRRSG